MSEEERNQRAIDRLFDSPQIRRGQSTLGPEYCRRDGEPEQDYRRRYNRMHLRLTRTMRRLYA